MKKINARGFIIDTINNGGNSVSLNGKIAKTGYMVSKVGFEFKKPIQELTVRNVETYVSDNNNILLEDNVYLGSWIDNDIFYLDVSMNIQDKEIALKIARENKQLAIYDIENNTSIYL